MARKAQAALEYIVTYGWGFLVIIVVVGVLAYFGLFSPSRYVPARCDFGAQLQCADYMLQTGSPGAVKLKLRNNFGDDIEIRRIYLFADESPTWSGSVIIDKGNISEIPSIQVADPALLPDGDRVSVPVVVTFRRAAPAGPDHNVTGEIFATVQ